MTASAIYEGRVRHRRYAPVRHEFAYRVFMMYLDLDELPGLFEGRLLWSCDGGGLARFRRRDHLRGEAPAHSDLKRAALDLVERRTGRRPDGAVRLLTHLEYFRYRFNPVSFYYCFAADGESVQAVIAEINNTPWGEQHCYVLDCPPDLEAREARRWTFRKDFHISPFMPMDMTYDWRFTPPASGLTIHMQNRRGGALVFDAAMSLRRREISAASLRSVLLRHPFMTARVIAAIYWQALRLWLRRCPVVPHPKTLPTGGDGLETG